MYRIIEADVSTWAPQIGEDESHHLAGELELGKIIYLPHLPFAIAQTELRFLDTRWLSGTHKSISFDATRAATDAGLRGARGDSGELVALAALIARFRTNAAALLRALFPRYAHHLRMAPTSLRPGDVETHKISWRKDDTLLHVDAFPSRPNHGERILRVITNVHTRGVPRVWKIGDLFEKTAGEFLPRMRAPLPGGAALLHALHVTKSRRSLYDHIMLGMHDQMKLDRDYQQRKSHLTFGFRPGSTWICFSDQAAHAALSGQYMLEQTLHLPLAALYFPERSPLRLLERMHGTALI